MLAEIPQNHEGAICIIIYNAITQFGPANQHICGKPTICRSCLEPENKFCSTSVSMFTQY